MTSPSAVPARIVRVVAALIAAGYDTRLTPRNLIVVRTSVSRTTFQRALYPEGKGAIITRPAPGYFTVAYADDSS